VSEARRDISILAAVGLIGLLIVAVIAVEAAREAL
jgi:hypothetical protein